MNVSECRLENCWVDVFLLEAFSTLSYVLRITLRSELVLLRMSDRVGIQLLPAVNCWRIVSADSCGDLTVTRLTDHTAIQHPLYILVHNCLKFPAVKSFLNKWKKIKIKCDFSLHLTWIWYVRAVTHPVAVLVFFPLLHHLQPFLSSLHLQMFQLWNRERNQRT